MLILAAKVLSRGGSPPSADGVGPQRARKSPSSGRCRFGLIKSYAEPVRLSLVRILGNFDFLAISEL
jgi:hypothetical protein